MGSGSSGAPGAWGGLEPTSEWSLARKQRWGLTLQDTQLPANTRCQGLDDTHTHNAQDPRGGLSQAAKRSKCLGFLGMRSPDPVIQGERAELCLTDGVACPSRSLITRCISIAPASLTTKTGLFMRFFSLDWASFLSFIHCLLRVPSLGSSLSVGLRCGGMAATHGVTMTLVIHRLCAASTVSRNPGSHRR